MRIFRLFSTAALLMTLIAIGSLSASASSTKNNPKPVHPTQGPTAPSGDPMPIPNKPIGTSLH